MKSLTYASCLVISSAFAGGALASNEPPYVPTGYQVDGCNDYVLDVNTNKVIQACKDDAATFFFERVLTGDDSPTDSGDTE